MNVTAYDIAERFVGIKEITGTVDNPAIMTMLRLDEKWPSHDEVPWCSAFVNYICWLLRLPRSKSLRARSWLNVGMKIELVECVPAYDVVIIKQGDNDPGPEVIDAVGHVGFYSQHGNNTVAILGGNQSNSVNYSTYPISRILGVRRLKDWLEDL